MEVSIIDKCMQMAMVVVDSVVMVLVMLPDNE